MEGIGDEKGLSCQAGGIGRRARMSKRRAIVFCSVRGDTLETTVGGSRSVGGLEFVLIEQEGSGFRN